MSYVISINLCFHQLHKLKINCQDFLLTSFEDVNANFHKAMFFLERVCKHRGEPGEECSLGGTICSYLHFTHAAVADDGTVLMSGS